MLLKLAFKDLLFDRLISSCQIAAIASIIAPLLLLFSLRHGILTELETKLLQDPKVLSLTLDTSYRLDTQFFVNLNQQPEVGFVIPEVAALSALVDIKFKSGAKRVSIMPTAFGDPVVAGSGISFGESALQAKESTAAESTTAEESKVAQGQATATAQGQTDSGLNTVPGSEDQTLATEEEQPLQDAWGVEQKNQDTDLVQVEKTPKSSDIFKVLSYLNQSLDDDEVFISEDLAAEREVKVGDSLLVIISRTLNGQRQSARVNFKVKGVIKQRFLNDDVLFANLKVVTALDDYRNGYEPVIFSDGSNVKTTPRYYAKFRLFAKDIDAVIPLYYKLKEQHLSVSSKVGEIENIQAIARVMNFIFVVIALVSGIGGALALSGLMLSSLKGRKKNFVLLRLMGQRSSDTYLIVFLENFILSSLGFALAFCFYYLGSYIFNQYFGALLPKAMISSLTFVHILGFYGATVLVAAILAMWSAKYIFLRAHIADVLREA